MNPQVLFALAANAPPAPDWWTQLVTEPRVDESRRIPLTDGERHSAEGDNKLREAEIRARLRSEAQWAWNRAGAIIESAPFQPSSIVVPPGGLNGGLRRVD